MRLGFFGARTERDRHRLRRVEAVGRVFRERSEHDGVKGVGRPRCSDAWSGRRCSQYFRDDVAFGIRREQALSDQRLPEHDAHGVHVAQLGYGAVELLRRHVGELALELSLARDLRASGGLCDPEIEHPRAPIGADHHILRRDVAMDDAEPFSELVARLVRGVQAVEGVANDRGRDGAGHALAALAGAAEQLRERLTLNVFHDEKHLATIGDHVDYRHDVRVPNAPGEAGLVKKHGRKLRVLCELRVHSLDGDRSGETGGAEQPPEVHGRHSARREGAAQHVPADDLRFGHRRG